MVEVGLLIIAALQISAAHIVLRQNETASRILQSLNTDVDPCTDFYEFACGRWTQHNPMPKWAVSWSPFNELIEQVNGKLRGLLEVTDAEELPKSVLKAKSLYRTCMDTEKLDEKGIKPIEDLLQNLGLPTRPPSEVSANFTWESVAGRSRRMLGLNVLLTVKVAEDLLNMSRKFVTIKPITSGIGISLSHLLLPERYAHVLALYHKDIQSRISIFDPETDAAQFADDIVEFSTNLAKIITPDKAPDNDTSQYQEVSVQQLIEGFDDGPAQWKEHDWGHYLDLVFADTNVTLHQELDYIRVTNLPYLQRLSVLLSDTKPVIIERFLWYSVFSNTALMTLHAFRSLSFEYDPALYKLQHRQPRWETCTSMVNDYFSNALSYLYVKKYFDASTAQKVTEMTEEVRAAFAQSVQELDWLDSTTRNNTLDKLRSIRSNVGYPDWITTKELDKHYEYAQVVEGNLFETYLKLTFSITKMSLESLREKPDRNKWASRATEVNAIYLARLNSVTIPAAILQPPFFGNGIEAIDYGAIGVVLGHEVTHGFDDLGRLFDKDGNMRNWWSAASMEHYEDKYQCLIDQYSNYSLADLANSTTASAGGGCLDTEVDGVDTLGENIADNGGMRAALRAFRHHSARANGTSTLPGLSHYSPEQLFFLGFAQVWCSNSTVAALKEQLTSDVHSPNKVRVIGTLSNSQDFADAWHCPSGSPMNPPHKCVVW